MESRGTLCDPISVDDATVDLTQHDLVDLTQHDLIDLTQHELIDLTSQHGRAKPGAYARVVDVEDKPFVRCSEVGKSAALPTVVPEDIRRGQSQRNLPAFEDSNLLKKESFKLEIHDTKVLKRYDSDDDKKDQKRVGGMAMKHIPHNMAKQQRKKHESLAPYKMGIFDPSSDAEDEKHGDKKSFEKLTAAGTSSKKPEVHEEWSAFLAHDAEDELDPSNALFAVDKRKSRGEADSSGSVLLRVLNSRINSNRHALGSLTQALSTSEYYVRSIDYTRKLSAALTLHRLIEDIIRGKSPYRKKPELSELGDWLTLGRFTTGFTQNNTSYEEQSDEGMHEMRLAISALANGLAAFQAVATYKLVNARDPLPFPSPADRNRNTQIESDNIVGAFFQHTKESRLPIRLLLHGFAGSSCDLKKWRELG